MIQEYQVRILPEQAASEEGIKRYLSKEKGLDVRTLNQVRVLKRSIDARQRTIFVNLKVRAYINEFPQGDQYVHTEYPDVSSCPRVIVVGEGPGGLFASLRLIELGYRPIVLERGKDVRERKKDLHHHTRIAPSRATIARTHTIDNQLFRPRSGRNDKATRTHTETIYAPAIHLGDITIFGGGQVLATSVLIVVLYLVYQM